VIQRNWREVIAILVGEAKVRRHHADNGGRNSIHQDPSIEDVLVAAKSSHPEPVADQDHRGRVIHLVFSLRDQSPHQRLNAQSLQESGGDIFALNSLGGDAIFFDPEIYRVVHNRAQSFKGIRLLLPIEQVGNGNTVELVKMGRSDRKDGDQTVCIAIRQRPKEDTVHQRENCGVQANSDGDR